MQFKKIQANYKKNTSGLTITKEDSFEFMRIQFKDIIFNFRKDQLDSRIFSLIQED